MIKRLIKTDDIDEANRLLDEGWVLMLEEMNLFLLAAHEEVWEKAKKASHLHYH